MYFLLDENNYKIGMSMAPIGNCTNTPIKPLIDDETAFFNKDTNKWEYDFGKQSFSLGETPYILIDYSPASIYTSDILPQCGDICLKKSKKISILIPCYNKAKYIKDCVKSCINQTMTPTNIVILLMDEESIKLKQELEMMSNNITCIEHERLNASAARTLLVKKYCPTNWFIFLDADDLLKENFIEECYNTPGSFIFPRMQTIEEDGSMEYDCMDLPLQKIGYPSACLFNNLTSLMHKNVFNSIGLDEELSSGGEDFDFMVRLFEQKKYKINMATNTYYCYRSTQGLANSDKFFETHHKAVLKNLEFLHKEYLKIFGNQKQENYFYNHPSLEEYSQIFENNIAVLFAEKYDVTRTRLQQSKLKEPMDAFSSQNFTLLNSNDNIENFAYEGLTFDVLFCEELNYYNIYNDDLKMIVNNKILKDPKFMSLHSYNKLTYLLNTYSCFELKINEDHSTDTNELEKKFRVNAADNKIIKKQLELLSLPKKTMDCKTSKNFPVSFILHKECNLNCPYCNEFKRYRHNELTDDEIFDNFNKNLTYIENTLGSEYYIRPGILGGEPTLWSDYLIKKIMDRLKDYRVVKLFTNGTNKNSIWYQYDNVMFQTHIVDWTTHPEKLTFRQLGKGEIPLVVVTHQETDKIIEIIKDKSTYIKNTVISHCAGSEDESYNSTAQDIKKINEAQEKYNINATALNKCSTFRVFSVDCNTNLTSRCCRHKELVPIEISMKEFLEKDNSKCAGCIVFDTLED